MKIGFQGSWGSNSEFATYEFIEKLGIENFEGWNRQQTIFNKRKYRRREKYN